MDDEPWAGIGPLSGGRIRFPGRGRLRRRQLRLRLGGSGRRRTHQVRSGGDGLERRRLEIRLGRTASIFGGRLCDRGVRDRRRLRRAVALVGAGRGRNGRGRRGLRIVDWLGGRRFRPLARTACGKEPERVEVAVLVGRDANAEMDIGNRPLRVARRTDRADLRPFCDRRVALHGKVAEVDEGHGVTVGRLDRDARTVARSGAGERDRSAVRREHPFAGLAADVDTPMLARGVRISSEAEGAEHGPGHGPRPGGCGRGETKCQGRNGENCSQVGQQAIHGRKGRPRCQIWLQFRHSERR
jgi:hypothetical protein